MSEGITRRGALIGGAAVAAATAAALGGCSSDDGADASSAHSTATTRSGATHPTREPRVVVVGAGLAGLTCALDLVALGREVLVLEARDRVGGRVHTIRSEAFTNGLHAEAGGESIDTDHHDLLAMIERFGLKTEPRPANKILDGLTSWKGQRLKTSDFVARHGGTVGTDYERFYTELQKLADGIDPLHPERHPGATELDAMSLKAFVDSLHLVAEARFLVDSDNRGEFNAEAADISMLFVAQQWAVGTDIADSGVEAMRISGGNDQLPRAMAEELGDIIELGAPVNKIRHDATGVTVTAGEIDLRGSWVVLACPFVPLRRVSFQPALPQPVADAIAGLDLGDAAKVTIQYRDRFWTHDETGATSGFTVTDEPVGIAWSPTDSYGSTTDPGLLTAFITGAGAKAAAKQTDAARIAAVRREFEAIYPGAAGADAHHQATTAWANERYTGGGYAVHHPGQMARFWPVIRSGTGRIRFAGEHTETLAGYMESAIRSGHRVAKEIDAASD